MVLYRKKYLENHLSRHLILAYIPIFLLIILYSVILIKLKSHNIPGNQSITSAERQRRMRNRNVLKMVFCYGCWVYIVLVTSQFELNSSTPDPEKTNLSLLSVPSTHNAFNGIVLYNHQYLHVSL